MQIPQDAKPGAFGLQSIISNYIDARAFPIWAAAAFMGALNLKSDIRDI